MATIITVVGAATVTSILHPDLETVEQRAENITDTAHSASWPIHNTLDLRVEGEDVEVTVDTETWPVVYTIGEDETRVEKGDTATFTLDGTARFRELPEFGRSAGTEEAE